MPYQQDAVALFCELNAFVSANPEAGLALKKGAATGGFKVVRPTVDETREYSLAQKLFALLASLREATRMGFLATQKSPDKAMESLLYAYQEVADMPIPWVQALGRITEFGAGLAYGNWLRHHLGTHLVASKEVSQLKEPALQRSAYPFTIQVKPMTEPFGVILEVSCRNKNLMEGKTCVGFSPGEEPLTLKGLVDELPAILSNAERAVVEMLQLFLDSYTCPESLSQSFHAWMAGLSDAEREQLKTNPHLLVDLILSQSDSQEG